MIIEFRVQNYRSFRKEQTLSFVASNYDKSLPENIIAPELPGLPDLRLVKAVALYGPNAGGKTNVLVALSFLKWLVIESASGQKPDAMLPVQPFALDKESPGQPTMLHLTFVVDKVRYELAVAVTKERVVQERLVAYPNGHAQIWYDRVWNEETKSYEWSGDAATDFKRDPDIVEKTRPNTLFLSAAAQWNNAQVAPLYTWFASKLLFLQLGPEQLLLNEYVYTAQTVSSSSDAGKLITDLLQSADFGVKNISAVDESRTERAIKTFGALKTFVREAGVPANTMPEKAWRVTFQHEGKDGELFPIEWGEASAGTQRFFTILGPWLSVALYNQVLCVDELDTSLHPSLAAELLRLFFQRAGGKDGSQVIFTTHNPLLLDMTILRRDQIWFVDKSQEGESFLYPLTDYKPRADESLVRGYLSGRYGAVPFIPRGLTAGAEDEPANQTENVPHAG
jgi:AAA15 family ATPase/GTPase